MAELLRNSKHEEQHRRDQRMALPQNTHVYMETVETSKNKEKKSDKDGSTRILCEYGGNCRRGHWYCANLTTVKKAMKKRD